MHYSTSFTRADESLMGKWMMMNRSGRKHELLSRSLPHLVKLPCGAVCYWITDDDRNENEKNFIWNYFSGTMDDVWRTSFVESRANRSLPLFSRRQRMRRRQHRSQQALFLFQNNRIADRLVSLHVGTDSSQRNWRIFLPNRPLFPSTRSARGHGDNSHENSRGNVNDLNNESTRDCCLSKKNNSEKVRSLKTCCRKSIIKEAFSLDARVKWLADKSSRCSCW